MEGGFPLMPLCLKENQEIDYEGIRSNIEGLEEKGVPGFIMFGCMGQMNAPSEEEFNKVCDVAVEASKNKKIACVVSSTSTSTKESIRRAKYAEEAGADGSMLALPYAFPVVEKWAVEFYQMVAEALTGEMSIMLYNFPPLNGFDVTPALWKEHLLKIESIRAVKDSNSHQGHRAELLFTIADKVNVFAGSEYGFWHDSLLGGKRSAGQFTWVAPRLMVRFHQECMKGNHKSPWVLGVYKALLNARKGFFHPSAPLASYEATVVNHLAEMGGFKGGPPRKPYGRFPEEALKVLEELVRPLMEMEKEL